MCSGTVQRGHSQKGLSSPGRSGMYHVSRGLIKTHYSAVTLVQATGPDAFPQRFGLVGDLGQTDNSSSTLGHLIDADLPVCGPVACSIALISGGQKL